MIPEMLVSSPSQHIVAYKSAERGSCSAFQIRGYYEFAPKWTIVAGERDRVQHGNLHLLRLWISVCRLFCLLCQTT